MVAVIYFIRLQVTYYKKFIFTVSPNCPKLDEVFPAVNFLYNCDKENNIGSLCALECPPGQILKGANSLICTVNRQWSPNFHEISCGNLLR